MLYYFTGRAIDTVWYVVQQNAAQALAHLALPLHEQSCTLHLLEEGAVPCFIKLLASNHHGVLGAAACALAHLSGDASCRAQLLQEGVVEPLVDLCNSNRQTNLQQDEDDDQTGNSPVPTLVLRDICRTFQNLSCYKTGRSVDNVLLFS